VYGNVTLETALKNSYNTAAVRMLDQVGIDKAFDYLDLLQFKKINQNDHSLPAALGGFSYGMTPLELTNAYTTFATNGKFIPAHGITTVTDKKGKQLYKWDEKETTVWSTKTNTMMRELLSKVVTEGTARRAYFPSQYIGGKTGTTNGFKDLWFIGLTSEYTAGVWVGKDRPTSIEAIDHATPQLSIWRMVMERASIK
jgi:penicillin-binding protein 1A